MFTSCRGPRPLFTGVDAAPSVSVRCEVGASSSARRRTPSCYAMRILLLPTESELSGLSDPSATGGLVVSVKVAHVFAKAQGAVLGHCSADHYHRHAKRSGRNATTEMVQVPGDVTRVVAQPRVGGSDR